MVKGGKRHWAVCTHTHKGVRACVCVRVRVRVRVWPVKAQPRQAGLKFD